MIKPQLHITLFETDEGQTGVVVTTVGNNKKVFDVTDQYHITQIKDGQGREGIAVLKNPEEKDD